MGHQKERTSESRLKLNDPIAALADAVLDWAAWRRMNGQRVPPHGAHLDVTGGVYAASVHVDGGPVCISTDAAAEQAIRGCLTLFQAWASKETIE